MTPPTLAADAASELSPDRDQLLLALAALPDAELTTVLAAGAPLLGATSAAVWLRTADGESRCAAARGDEGQAPDWAALARARTATAESALEAGIWRDGALAGGLRFSRPAAPWTTEERAFAAALADRATVALEREARRQAEAALREREEKVAEVEALAQLGSWEQMISEGAGRDPIRWSPELLRIHGCDPARAPRSYPEFLELVHPDDRERVREATREVVKARGAGELLVRTCRPDGEVRHLLSRARVVEGPDGRPRLIGTSQDVTELMEARQALAAREAQLAEAQRIAGVGSWEWDLRTGRIAWSDELYRLHGWEPGGVIAPECFFDRVHEEDRGWMSTLMAEARASGSSFEFEYRVVREDSGETRWLRGRFRVDRDGDGTAVRMMGTAQDIHEARAAREAQRASEESYRTIFESSSDAIFLFDPQTGRILEANRRAGEMCGATREELAADAAAFLWNGPAPYTPELALEQVRRAAAGEAQRFEWMSIQPRTGEPIWGEVSVQAVVVRGELRVLALVRDIGERKRAEQALRESEESYRAIFDSSSDAIFVQDLESGAILEANRAACVVHGFTLEEMRTRGMELIGNGPPPFTPDLALEFIHRAAGGEPQRFEWCSYHAATGEEIWVEVSLQRVAIRGAERLLAMVRDIRSRKRAEEALRASEESYRTIFEHSTDGIWLHDMATGAVVDVNTAGAELHGYTLDEMRSLPHEALLCPGTEFTAERVAGYLARAAAGETPRFEWMNRHRDGTPVWAEVTLRRVTIAGADRILATVRDIRERRAAEEALRASEENYRTIFDAAGAAIWVHDLETGEFIDVNQGACDLYGWSVEEQKALGFQGLVWGEAPYTLEHARALRDRAAAGAPQTFEWLGKHRDGEPVWAEVSLRRVSINGVDRVLATARDISDRKRAEDALRRANEELERRVEERTGELAAANEALAGEIREHQAARREVQAREEHFRRLIENAHDMVLVVDGTRTLYASPAVERITCCGPLDVSPASDRVHPEDGPRVLAELGRLAGDPSATAHLEYRFRHADGHWLQLEAFGKRLDPDGSSERMVLNVRDVTDRRRAEAEVAQQKEFFEKVLDGLDAGIAVFDLEGRYEYLSEKAVPDAELRRWMIGKTILEYGAHKGVREEIARARHDLVHVAVQTGRTTELEERLAATAQRPSRYILRRCVPILNGDGQILRVVGYSIDITERKQAEEALRRSEEHFRALIENGGDYLIIVDREGTITYAGPSVEHILGYRPEEMIGKRPPDMIHPDDVPRMAAVLEAITANPGSIHSVEYRIRHKDGSWRVMDNVGKTLSPDTADAGIVSNGRDVTDRRRAEEALRRATEEAERANRAKSEFLSRMSHELRTPMNSILGFAQLLGRATLPPEQQKGVQHILKAGRHLLNLINEVLEISRIEAGRQTLSLEPVRVGTVVQEALGLVRPLAAQWSVRLVDGLTHEEAGRFVQADRQRLSQVLLNLLSNAIKYNRPGGSVRIDVQARERVLAIRVADTGMGIAPDRLEQLFTPFARLGAEQGEVEGTGLGLALSQRLAEAMSGGLTLESSSPDGSVFRVELALAEDPMTALDSPATAAAAGEATSHRAVTLLYVEDNLANLALVESILLSRPQWQVIPALQGQLGLELACQHRPDLVLLDLHLPDLPGETVLRRLRADRRTAGIPVVVVSADATPAMVDRLHAAGADAYLTKPLEIDEFLATVDRFVEGRP